MKKLKIKVLQKLPIIRRFLNLDAQCTLIKQSCYMLLAVAHSCRPIICMYMLSIILTCEHYGSNLRALHHSVCDR